MMNGMNAVKKGENLVALGRLETVASFGARPNIASGLPDDFPVLTFPLRAIEARCLGNTYRESDFGFGHVDLADGMLMTMRLQLDGVQFNWLAEITDPELWEALDKWRSAGRFLFGLKIENRGKWDIRFVAIEGQLGTLSVEKCRYGPRRVVTSHDWQVIANLTDVIRMGATTDIDDVPLCNVFAGGLLTKQFEQAAQEEVKVKKLVVVKDRNGGALVMM